MAFYDLGEQAALEKFAASALRSRVGVTPVTTSTGNIGFTLHLGDKPIGQASLYGPARDGAALAPRISRMNIDPAYQGLGLGKKFYGEMMRRMPNQTLASDSATTGPARQTWRGMEDRKGYTFRETSRSGGTPHSFQASLPPEAAVSPAVAVPALPRTIPGETTPEIMLERISDKQRLSRSTPYDAAARADRLRAQRRGEPTRRDLIHTDEDTGQQTVKPGRTVEELQRFYRSMR